MRMLSHRYQNDIVPYAGDSIEEFFDRVKNLPYRKDPAIIYRENGVLKKTAKEVLQRPAYTLNNSGLGGDCDDKAICMGAFCSLKRIPFRFVAVSRVPNIPLHHVYTEAVMGGNLYVLDPTYSFNTFNKTMWNPARRMELTHF